jgi:hypothetical protein
MANGYVQNMNPLFRQPFHQRFPAPQRPPTPPSNNPSALFASRDDAQCLFPSAFPAEGPNIIQRFWIRLFTILIYGPYTFLHQNLTETYAILATLDAELLTVALLENRWSILIGLIVVVLASVGAYFFSPKGENNT